MTLRSAPGTVPVLSLDAAGADDAARVGRKAATLARLARAGFAVPEGLVLTTAAVGLLEPEALPALPLPDALEAALAEVADRFGDAVLAVRSSAVAEDLPGASYAGVYETVLHVRGLAALRDAVLRCWASAHTERVRSYRGRAAGPIAVLVQRQADPDVAGVAFTADPVTGERDVVLVSAVPGLGDALVSGAAQPDEWRVGPAGATPVSVVHQALTESQAHAVADLARRIERELGGPQDVEWAMAEGRLLVLQARPITALPRPPEAALPPGTWVKDVEHYPEPLTALGASLAAPAVAEGLSRMLERYGGLLERMDVRMIGGEAYLRPVPPGGRDGPPPPWWALGLLARLAPPLRRRMRAARRRVTGPAFAELLHDWETVDRPQLEQSIDRLGAVRPSELDDAALGRHLDAAVRALRDALELHFHLLPLYVVPAHDLVEACRTLLGWDDARALELLSGTSTASTEPTRALAALAARIAADPAARSAVERADGDLAERLAAASPALAAAFGDWCATYGERCVHDDPGSPVFNERPWLIAGLLRDALAGRTTGATGRAADAVRTAATTAARAELVGRAPRERARFERLLETALRYHPLREDTTVWISCAGGLVRRAALAVGQRLADRGLLDRAEDAVDLDVDTLRRALAGPAPGDLRARVGTARAERAWVRLHPGPAVSGPDPGPPPDVRGLPAPARRLNAALLWAQPRRPEGHAGSATLVGVAASPGRCTGPVRLVRTEADFPRLRPGDVLVTRTTDPAWSVLFGTAGALVTDGGGLLSHAAIVAREHGIPAVVGTAGATTELRDGEVVTVDGGTGRVLRSTASPGTEGARP